MKRQFDKYTNPEKIIYSYDNKCCKKSTSDKKDLYKLLYPNDICNYDCLEKQFDLKGDKNKYFDCSLKTPICEIPKDEILIDPNTIDKYEYFNYSYGFEEINVSSGGYLELSLKSDDCEVRGDIVLKNASSFILWGEIRDKCNNPVPNLLVTLLKPIYIRGICKYIAESNTRTNTIGFYQFNISKENKNLKYKVLLGNIC